MKAYIVGFRWNPLTEAIPLSIYNVCFHREIRKTSTFDWESLINPCPAEPGYTLPLQTV